MDRHLGWLASGPAGAQGKASRAGVLKRKKHGRYSSAREVWSPFTRTGEGKNRIDHGGAVRSAVLTRAGGIEAIFRHTGGLIKFLIRGGCHMAWHRRMRARCAYADSWALRMVPFVCVDVARHSTQYSHPRGL